MRGSLLDIVGSVFFLGLSSAEATLDVAATRAEIQSLRTEVERLRRLQEPIPVPENEHLAYLEELRREVLDLRSTKSKQESAITTVWIFVCGTLCVFMHVGFAMVETGTCRARNASDLLIKNVLSVCVGTLGWWSFGWGFAFGEVQHGFIGTTGFFASDLLKHTSNGIQPVDNCDGGVCTSRMLQCFFQWAFCTTTTSSVSGAVAERIRSPTFVMYSLCMSSFIYPVVVAWTWGGGWLSEFLKVGFTDLAGSGVVHLTGGISGLVGAIIVRPRAGRFQGNAVSFEAHNLPLAVLGTLFLWVGWFGFNAGSVGAMRNGLEASLAAHIAMNTVLSGATGGLTVMLLRWIAVRKYDVGGLCNGILAGVVSITAGCSNITNLSAIGVAAVGGLLYQLAANLLQRLHIDDPVNAFPVHGVCGLWGCLAAVLCDWGGFDRFHGMNGWECFRVSSPDTTDRSCFGPEEKGLALLVWLIFMVCVILWAGGLSFILFQSAQLLGLLRVDHEADEKGIDAIEHAQNRAYNFSEQQGPNSWRVLWFQ